MTKEMLEYSICSFSFLLPRNGKYTFQEWYNLIVSAYSSTNCKTNKVANEVNKIKGFITRRNGVNYLIEIDKQRNGVLEVVG